MRIVAYVLVAILFLLLCSNPFAPVWAFCLLPLGVVAGAVYCAKGWQQHRWKMVAAITPGVLAAVGVLMWLPVRSSPRSFVNLTKTATVRADNTDLILVQITDPHPLPSGVQAPNLGIAFGFFKTASFWTRGDMLDYYVHYHHFFLTAQPSTPGATPSSIYSPTTTAPTVIGTRWLVLGTLRSIRIPVVVPSAVLGASSIVWLLIVGGWAVLRRFMPVRPLPSASVADKMHL